MPDLLLLLRLLSQMDAISDLNARLELEALAAREQKLRVGDELAAAQKEVQRLLRERPENYLAMKVRGDCIEAFSAAHAELRRLLFRRAWSRSMTLRRFCK